MSTPTAPQAQTLREQLAEYAHDAWAGWMKYMFGKGEIRWAELTPYMNQAPGKVLIIPAWAVERWQRQMDTPYAELPESEKESDRAEADRMLALMQATIDRQAQRIAEMEQAARALYAALEEALEPLHELIGADYDVSNDIGKAEAVLAEYSEWIGEGTDGD